MKVLFQALLCMVVQAVIPLLVGIHTVMEVVTDEDQSFKDQSIFVIESLEWENVCLGYMEWDVGSILIKVVASVLLIYMFNYLETKQKIWQDKATFRMLVGEPDFCVPAAFISHNWSGVGLLMNGLALIWSGLVSIVIIYSAETAVDIVLNSLALFFVVDIDNDIVSPDGKDFAEKYLDFAILFRRAEFQHLRENGDNFFCTLFDASLVII